MRLVFFDAGVPKFFNLFISWLKYWKLYDAESIQVFNHSWQIYFDYFFNSSGITWCDFTETSETVSTHVTKESSSA